MGEMRLDQWLVEHGLFESREKARAAIERGWVVSLPQRLPLTQPSKRRLWQVSEIEIVQRTPFVSRAGEKLYYFLTGRPSPELKNALCLDIGSSTGGFIDCLLQMGAREVVGVDSGMGQLHPRLQSDPRVANFEGTDIREFKWPRSGYPEIVTIDVSFIPIIPILRAIHSFIEKSEVIVLWKPQFNLGPLPSSYKGVVPAEEARQSLQIFASFLREEMNANLLRIEESQIPGKEGNIEFFFYFNWKTKQ